MRIVVETDASIAGWSKPAQGDVWLFVETGLLYEMREWKNASGPNDRTMWDAHRTAHRIGAPESDYGCEPAVFVAVFDDAVKHGRWIRVMNCPAVVATE
jgi:hypothetical protein